MKGSTRILRPNGSRLLAMGSRLVALSAAMFALQPALGAAQDQAAAESEAAPTTGARGGQLEEIVVTATRREEVLSKVPISVTALSQDVMDQKGIRDFQDIVRFTPGVSIDTSGTNAISIRGISSSGGAGTTGIYIDDTPIQMRAVGFNPDDTLPKTFDLERVEVLRGPQGTLFGSGSEGGTVRYIMTQPSLTRSSTYGRSEVSFTRYGQPNYEAGIAHGEPIIDGKLGIRASAWYRQDGGWIDRVDPTTRQVTERHTNRGGTVVLRLAAAWQPVSALTITPSITYQNSKKHDVSTYWPAYSNPGAGQFATGTPERYPVPDEYYLPSLKIEFDLGGSEIFSNTSFFHRNETTGYQGTVYDLAYFQGLGWPSNNNFGCGSASTTPVSPCSWYPLIDATGIHLPAGFTNYSTPNSIINQQESVAQEIRWQSSDKTARLNWTLGAFWSLTREVSIEELRDTRINDFFQAIYAINATDFFGPYYYCNGVGTPGLGFPACDIYYNRNKTHDRQIAGFGELNYALTDQWKITAGARVSRVSFDLNHYADGLENFGPSVKSAEQHETPFTPKLSVAYQMDNSNLFYATYAKGFRVGGGNAPLIPACVSGVQALGYANGQAPLTYKSDSTQSYEVGSKNTFANALRIATSVYYIKWRDIQQNVYVPGNCGLQFTDNLGTAVAKGFDLQAEIALGSAITVDASVGYTSARYSADSTRANLAHKGDAISGEAAVNYSPGTNPPWTTALGVQYNFAALSRDAFVRMDYEYQSRNNWPSTLQDPASRQFNANTYALPSTSFASIRGGINLGGWAIAGFVDNLFNTSTVSNYAFVQSDPFNPNFNAALPTSVQQNQFTFRPRTIGITASFRSQ